MRKSGKIPGLSHHWPRRATLQSLRVVNIGAIVCNVFLKNCKLFLKAEVKKALATQYNSTIWQKGYIHSRVLQGLGSIATNRDGI